MAKILILANNDVGLYKFRKELLEALVKENDVFVSLPYGDFVTSFVKIGCNFIETPINRRGKNPFTDFKLFFNYITIMNKIKPDIVLTYTIKPNIYGGIACRINKVPYISNITGLGTAVENKGFMQKITLFLYKLSLSKAKCIYLQNKENRDFLSNKKILKGNYKIIPGSGVNLNQYPILNYPSEDRINFLFIARIMKEKGIDQYLEAAEFIRRKYPMTAFHILGACEQEVYEKKLMHMQDKGIIKYHGMQKDVRKFQEKSHCTIHPSYYPEGMSNVLLESAACGRPIITSNRSGCRDIVDEGVNGFIVEAKNSKDLISKIELFLKLPHLKKREMGLAGRMKVEKEFDRQIVINSYLNSISNYLMK